MVFIEEFEEFSLEVCLMRFMGILSENDVGEEVCFILEEGKAC